MYTKDNQLFYKELNLSIFLLGNGLNNLRKGNLSCVGFYYQGLFSVTIGLERLMKLILALDFKLKNKRYPNENDFRKYSHKLYEIFNNIENLVEGKGYSDSDFELLKDDDIYKNILDVLSDFANIDRYYNLNNLNDNQERKPGPLIKWSNILKRAYQKHCRISQKRINLIRYLSDVRKDVFFVYYFDESDKEINDTKTFLIESEIRNKGSKYVMLYLLKIIRANLKILIKLHQEMVSPHPSSLGEIFPQFLVEEKTYILRKRDWLRK